MGVFSLCRKYVNALPKDKVFVTRDLLAYGSRDAVDKCTQAMVGSAMIRRMARGVFVRNDIGIKDPPIEKIVEAKARAFAKHIIPSPLAQAAGLGLESPRKMRRKRNRLVPQKPPFEGPTFAVLGTTSMFWTIHGTVKLQHVSARKYFVAQHKVGEILAGIWHASENAYIEFDSILRKANFTGEENRRFKELANWVPEWIHKHFRANYAGANIHSPCQLYPFSNLSFPETLIQGKGHSKVKEDEVLYQFDTEYGADLSRKRGSQDAPNRRDPLGVLAACVLGEYNFKLGSFLFSSS